MSKNSGIDGQTYCFVTEPELKSKVEKLRAEGYYLQIIEFADGQYFIISCTYKNGKNPCKPIIFHQTIPGLVFWKKGTKERNIAYIGGWV